MQAALKTTTRVLEGGKLELVAPQLPENTLVEVIILYPVTREAASERRSVTEILADAPGHRLFNTPAEVEDYLDGEKEAWDN